MVQLVKASQFFAAPEFATVISERYYHKKGDYPNGYGKWIFTAQDCEPLEVDGYYSSACTIAQKHFKKQGVRYCYVSTDSHNLKPPTRPKK